MREIAPLLLVGAAAVTFSVALEVFRRASLNTETRLLLLMLSTLGLEYVLLAFASFPIFRETPNELRLHYTAFVAGFVLQILFYGFGSHFIYLTAMRFNALDWSFSPMRTAFGFNRFSDQQFEQWAPFLISYLSAFVAIVMYAVPAAAAIIANSAPVMNRAERSFEFTRGMLWGYDLLWILTQTSILGSIYRRFPAERQKSAIARFIFEDRSGSGMLTRLGLSDREPSLPGDISTTIVMEFRALLTVGAGSVLRAVFTIALFSSAVKPDPSAPITFAYFLLPLLIVLPLIYYKSRFVFFDALIKRGTLAVLLVASAVISLPFAIVPFARAAGPATGLGERFFIAGFCVFFVSTWTGSYGRVERAIDRVLFRRPDYRELLREIGSGLKLFVESGPMIGYVCERLRTGIPAASVDYVAPSSREAKANGPLDAGNSRAAGGNCVVPLTHNNGNYGFLLLGARPHDQPYQSEDIAFLEAVAAHVAAMLHNLELRLERDKQENREAELRELARNAELRALKAQINPHFLFNALNNLADMAGDDPQAAQRTIGDLASVFKFTLESADRESVSLGEESDFIRAYLEIERMRFEDRLEYEVCIPEELKAVRIPPMLIQPIVENAVKHGISPLMSAGGKVIVAAAAHGETIEITVQDNGVGFDPVDKNSGVGLSNVRRRVESIFGAGSWSLVTARERGTTIRVSIALQSAGSTGSLASAADRPLQISSMIRA